LYIFKPPLHTRAKQRPSHVPPGGITGLAGVAGAGDVVVIPGGSERWFREDSEVIDFFAPPLLGGKPAYMSEG